MKLEVHERLALMQILDILTAKNNYEALKTLRRAKEMIGFTPDEVEFYEIKAGVDPNTRQPVTNWNPQKAAESVKDIPVDEYTTNAIRKKLAEMDKKHELTKDLMSLFEKFVVVFQ